MSNNLITNEDFYNWLVNINNLDFSDKSVLLIGAGNIAQHYAQAISKLGIKNTSVISNSETAMSLLCDEFNFKGYSGGYEKNLGQMENFDLVIIATPIPKLLPALLSAISYDQKNFLIEKPGSIYKNDFENLSKSIQNVQIRIAYNRLVYPNFIKLKTLLDKEKISSCRFSITERSDKISSLNKDPEILQRWGISNTLHVLSMISNIIGLPEKSSFFTSGELSWHVSGSKFVGAGLSEKNIPFSYHGDWQSRSGWGIEIFTKENTYKLEPLESLTRLTNDGGWEPISFDCAFPELKFGMAEEIAIMLSENSNFSEYLPSVQNGMELIELAESIFQYSQ